MVGPVVVSVDRALHELQLIFSPQGMGTCNETMLIALSPSSLNNVVDFGSLYQDGLSKQGPTGLKYHCSRNIMCCWCSTDVGLELGSPPLNETEHLGPRVLGPYDRY